MIKTVISRAGVAPIHRLVAKIMLRIQIVRLRSPRSFYNGLTANAHRSIDLRGGDNALGACPVGVDAHETRPTPPMATGWCSCASLLRQFIKAEPVSSRAIEMHFNCRLRLMCIDSSPSERLRAHRACSQKLGSSS